MNHTEQKWKTEPNQLEWFDESTGYRCAILRHHTGKHLCGYVQIPKSHILHKLHYRDKVPRLLQWKLDNVLQQPVGQRGVFTIFMAMANTDKKHEIEMLFDVHGSITFTGELADRIGTWYGFDCAHSGDLSPGYDELLMKHSPELIFRDKQDSYRSMEWVKQETDMLAAQVYELRWSNVVKQALIGEFRKISYKLKKYFTFLK